jgi:hypothetical protein
MKTRNLFNLYIVTTILLFLVIELRHFNINELHHFKPYPRIEILDLPLVACHSRSLVRLKLTQ